MDKFRWCFIGTGRLAEQVAKQITGSGNHEIAVCFSRNREKCREFAQRYNARSYGSSEEALHSGGFDAVYVVQQTFLCFFCGIWTLVDDVDDVLNLLTTLFDGIVQRLPLPRLLNLTVARCEE